MYSCLMPAVVPLALLVAWGLPMARPGASGRAVGLPGHMIQFVPAAPRKLPLPRLRLRGGGREDERAETESSSPPPPPPLDQDVGIFDCETDLEAEPSPATAVEQHPAGDGDGCLRDQPGRHPQAPGLFHTAAIHAIKLVDDGGVCIETLRAGKGGATPRDGDFVYVHYRAFVLGDPDRQAEILRSQRLSSPIVI